MNQILRWAFLLIATTLCNGDVYASIPDNQPTDSHPQQDSRAVGVEPQGLPVLEVTISEKSMPAKYTKGQMRLTYTDGTQVELNAKFKARGATAMQYSMKPSFNMKLRDEQGNEMDSTLCGLRSLSSWILDAMSIDRIGMRNRVAFDLWNDFSRLPYKTNFESRNGTVGEFVEVYINGTYKGIYCLTDRINRKLLNLKKPLLPGEKDEEDASEEVGEEVAGPTAQGGVTIRGVLYKHGTTDIGNQNSRAFSEDSCAYVIGYHDAWELAEPEDYAGAAAWAPLDSIYQHAHDIDWVRDHFYLEQLAEYQIFIMAMSICDNWGNKNSFISARNVTTDGNKHRFVYTPWDLDTSLGGSYNGSYYDGNYSDWTPANIMSASTMPVPFPICNKQSDYRTLLRDAWIRGGAGALSVDSVREKLYRYRDLFLQSGAWERATGYWETQKYKPLYVLDLAKEIDLIVAWYEKRFAEMDAYFNIDRAVGIANVNEGGSAKGDAYFNVMGQRVDNTNRRGIYIHQGKKYMVVKP